MKTHIISIQSQVARGYVGNNIAKLIIQLHGLDPITLPTVILSNPVGKLHAYGSPVSEPLFCDLLKGMTENKFIEQCDYLISGYCSSKSIISSIAEFVKATKNDKKYTYVYDPVCGDFRAGGLYIPKEAADYSIEQLLPLSDIITPNHFELEYILGEQIETEDQLLHIVKTRRDLQNKTIVATGMLFKDTLDNNIEVVLIKDEKIKRFVATRLPIEVDGSGDLFTAIICSQLNLSRDIEQAIEKGMAYLNNVLADTYMLGYKDLNTNILITHMNLLR